MIEVDHNSLGTYLGDFGLCLQHAGSRRYKQHFSIFNVTILIPCLCPTHASIFGSSVSSSICPSIHCPNCRQSWFPKFFFWTTLWRKQVATWRCRFHWNKVHHRVIDATLHINLLFPAF